jgi:hypothetical protein
MGWRGTLLAVFVLVLALSLDCVVSVTGLKIELRRVVV